MLSTGVIGVHLPLGKVREGLRTAAGALSPEGGADAADAILTTDTRAKTAVAGRDGFTVGGMAKGSGMIHPALATMLAVVTTDYPLEPGEATRSCARRSRRRFNRISVDGECSTNDAVAPARQRRLGRGARRRGLRGDASRGLRRPRAADRRGRGGDDRPDRDHRRGRRRRAAGRRDRPPHRHLAPREDGRLRARPELGPCARRGRLGAVQRRLRPARARPRPLALNGTTVFDGGAARRATPTLGGAVAQRSSSTSAWARAPRRTSPPTSPTTTCASTRSTRREAPRRQMRRSRRARPRPRPSRAFAAGWATSVCVVHGAGPQISAEMERRGLPVSFVGGRRVTRRPHSRSSASRSRA